MEQLVEGDILENTETYEQIVYAGNGYVIKSEGQESVVRLKLKEYGDNGLWFRILGVPGTFTPIANAHLLEEENLWNS